MQRPSKWPSVGPRVLLPACILLVLVVNVVVFVQWTTSTSTPVHPRFKRRYGEADGPALPSLPGNATCWFDDPKVKRVPTPDLEHLSLLQTACVAEADDIITWRYGANATTAQPTRLRRDDPGVLDELRRCPDIDIFLPSGLRGSGYCEDGVAYTKYGASRLLPLWALEDEYFDVQRNAKVTYFDLCPGTPVIFFNHYWPPWTWPRTKPIYLMPNIEMGELQSAQYWRASVVICKTRDCYHRVSTWYEQHGSPTGAAVVYSRHTSTDIAGHITRLLGADVRPKDFENVRFTHSAGGSVSKGTDQVLGCWLSRPDLPPLDLSMSEHLYNMGYSKYEAAIAASGNIHFDRIKLDEVAFGKRFAEASFFLCASRKEGYGHYINQARAAGGVIITTNGPPMNELVQAPINGVYVKTASSYHPDQMMGGNFNGDFGLRGFGGLEADYSAGDLCAAVDHVLELSTFERQRMGTAAQQAYHDDTKYFAAAMRNLRAIARAQLASNLTAADVVASGNWQQTALQDFSCRTV
ncbi:hypothetical protein SPRG_01332 [Saprolegnia parasitica CBS 223.65]|uniref:Glycosyl transferase family 1 domain-containing protein n=1 Tax=Saprolegnia parasitica (strain CBS 223.65) TaxID=695850 RepID=A0A067CU63_SAPPC|nr:hypothetical protein SPRG_01332 [Saprolegnia parasitica CBS 223.65]KDO34058.1 hypothetical protein SPRG_01332 [Saprolegnia parasitica CBS 223.65]|eukprot:XP_012194942.1 hypothetical protein SPRG_01332 [Saprolegnia parasitica CBS 223.65]